MTERSTPEQRRDRADLDPRFGKIGISAVAAALRYKSEPFNTAYAAPKPPKPERAQTVRPMGGPVLDG